MKRNACTWSVVLLASAALLISAAGCRKKSEAPKPLTEVVTPTPAEPAPAPEATTKPAPAPEATTKPAPAPEATTKPAPTPEATTKPAPTPKAIAKPAPAAKDAMEKLASALGVPAVQVPKLAEAPTIDGIRDAAYDKATPITLKFITGGYGQPSAKTTAWVVSTDKELIFFVKCESPAMDDLLADVREHDGQVWNDDCIELFIDPTNKRAEDGYMHVMVNSLGTTADAKGPAGSEDFSWEPKLRVKTKVGDKAWTVELAIPFADMVSDPAKINKAWAVNVNRMAYLLEGTEDTAWSPTESDSSHVPDMFGLMWLEAGTVDNSK